VIVWFFFSEGLNKGTKSILESPYLVKKVLFRVSLLPIVKILSCLFVHFIFLGLLFIFYFAHGYVPGIYALQLPYYLFATIMLLLGLSWITSSLTIFIKDVGQIITVIVRIGVWFTPVFWELDIFSPKTQFILKLNPVAYLIIGYRDSLFHKTWFWEHLHLTIYYWVVTLSIFIFGAVLFRRLRPHFADMI